MYCIELYNILSSQSCNTHPMYEITLGIENTGQRIMPNDKDMFFNLQAYTFRNSIAGNEHCYCSYCIELYYIVSSQPWNIIPMNEVVLDIGNITYNANDKDGIFYKRIISIAGRRHYRCMYCIALYCIVLHCIT